MLNNINKFLAKYKQFCFYTNMKISNISIQFNPKLIKQKENRKSSSVSFSANYTEEFDRENKYFNIPPFFKQNKTKLSKADFTRRVKELEDKGIDTLFAANIAKLGDEEFEKAKELINKGVEVEFIEDLAKFKQENYEQALKLWEKGFCSSSLFPIANLSKEKFDKAITLIKQGIDSDCVTHFVNLSENDYKKAIDLLKEGYPPIVAVHFCKLNKEQQATAQYFMDKDADVEVASRIAQFEEDKKAKCIEYTEMGINPEFVGELSTLNEKEKERVQRLIDLKIGDSNIADFAKMNNADYEKAMKMLKQGVYSDYIGFIIDEEKKNKNKEYKVYRRRNYSQTTAFSLALLSNQEIDALTKIIKKNPEMKKLFEDEYEVSLIDIQNDETAEAILTKEIRTENGTKIKLVRTFNEYAEKTESRTEEYSDNSTSSIMPGKSGVFKAKYNSAGEIKELTEYIQSPDTRDVIGVIHSKTSKLLSGVFESVYYDISDFKTDSSNFEDTIDKDIEECVTNKGEPISSVIQNPDDSITYTESLQKDEMLVDRNYTKKRDENGEIVYSSYEYKIQREDEEMPIMDISREFKRNADGSVDNTINGNKYHIVYDDKNKVISISDEKKEKRLFAKYRLPFYSQEVLWKEIKKLQADTILDIFDRIKQWNYCLDNDSFSNCYNRTISTGRNNSIILHEVGHLISNESPSILDNEDFVQTYGEEMQAFQENIPYNEQEQVQYFSPRAGAIGADGDDEFIAESNILLTTYGTSGSNFKNRSQFLEKYFPRTIAFVAEYTGKNSRKSLLE